MTPAETTTCATCGRAFEPRGGTAKYCAADCRPNTPAGFSPVDDGDSMAIRFRARLLANHGVSADTASAAEMFRRLREHTSGQAQNCVPCLESRMNTGLNPGVRVSAPEGWTAALDGPWKVSADAA